MGQKCAYNLLILNGNLEGAGFEWLPCLEGIKTLSKVFTVLSPVCLNGFPV